MSFRQLGIRRRLALLYTGIFAVGLGVFCAILFSYFQTTQLQAFDSTLYNVAVDFSQNLEMDFVGRLFVLNPNVTDASKMFPFRLGSSYLEIRDSHGRVLRQSVALGDKNLPLDRETLRRVSTEQAVFRTVSAASLGLKSTAPDLRLLTFWAQHPDWREPLILQIAVPLDLPMKEQRYLLIFFLIGIPTFLLISGFAGVWMSKRALRPVHDMTLKAQQITGIEKLKDRIPVPYAEDEISELASTFNGMLDRLDKAFASQDRFVSNASHQLKTPLTILKGELDILRKSRADRDELMRGLDSATDEIDRLVKLVQDLLLLARLEAGRDTITLTPVQLDDVLLQVVARLQKLARIKNVQITTHFASEDLAAVKGDADLLGSMLENFVENAIKYAPENSVVELSLKTSGEAVELRVRDHGPGVPADLRQKIFERFTRVQPSNVIPGSGLGLSIASEIARIHEADIALEGASSGTGTVVTLTFKRLG